MKKAASAIIVGFIVGGVVFSVFTIAQREFLRFGEPGSGPGAGFGMGPRAGGDRGGYGSIFSQVKRQAIPFIFGGIAGAVINFFYFRLRLSLESVKRMRTRLRRSERLAAVGELAAGLAHEIRNPLSSIDGAADYLAKGVPAGDPKREMADILLKESGRLSETLKRFLEFARPEELKIADCDIAAELQTTVGLLKSSKSYRNHSIDLRLVPGDLVLKADCMKLRQVFLNLGLNALEAMPDVGELSISARSSTADGIAGVSVEFRDSGLGIDPEMIGKLFDPFFTSKEEGTGLGLSISHRIIEDHEGSIEIESYPGRGTAITVFIPSERSDEPQDSAG